MRGGRIVNVNGRTQCSGQFYTMIYNSSVYLRQAKLKFGGRNLPIIFEKMRRPCIKNNLNWIVHISRIAQKIHDDDQYLMIHMNNWCESNCDGNWQSTGLTHWWFELQSEALAFELIFTE